MANIIFIIYIKLKEKKHRTTLLIRNQIRVCIKYVLASAKDCYGIVAERDDVLCIAALYGPDTPDK